MKRLFSILLVTFAVTSLYAQVETQTQTQTQVQAGGHCHFNDSKGSVRNGKVYEVVRTFKVDDKKEHTHSFGIQGSAEIIEILNVGGNYNYSTGSSNSSNSSISRRGYECCDDSICTWNYKEGKSIYAEKKKGKYLTPKK